MLFMKLVKVGIDKQVDVERHYEAILNTITEKPLMPVLAAMHSIMRDISEEHNPQDYSDVTPDYYTGIDDFIGRVTVWWRQAKTLDWTQSTQLIHDVKWQHQEIRKELGDDELFAAIYADITSHIVEPLIKEESTNGYVN